MTDRYTVDDRADVRDKLEDLGVHSVRQIRRAHGSHHHQLAQAQDTQQLDLYATGTPDQIAANLDALLSAKTVLGQQAAVVDGLLAEAQRLATPMSDGHGPIATAMSAAFADRTGDARGTVRALTDYRTELANVLAAIQQTLDTYSQSDLLARQRLSITGGDDA